MIVSFSIHDLFYGCDVYASKPRKIDHRQSTRIGLADKICFRVSEQRLRRLFASAVSTMRNLVGFVFRWSYPFQVGDRAIAWVSIKVRSDKPIWAGSLERFQHCAMQSDDFSSATIMHGESQIFALPIRADTGLSVGVANTTGAGNLIMGIRELSPSFHVLLMAHLRASIKDESAVGKADLPNNSGL